MKKTGSTTTCCDFPTDSATRLKVRSMVGLLPFCATTIFEPSQRERVPSIMADIRRASAADAGSAELHPCDGAGPSRCRRPRHPGLVSQERLRRILSRMLDENEFLSPHGIRALSRYHDEHPYVFYVDGQEYRVNYLPAESDTGMFGGNSNWRGPVWMPVNALLIRALLQFYSLLRRQLQESSAPPVPASG